MANISRRTRTVGTFASGAANSTVTLPTGATTGDSILLALATVGTSTIAKPSDWTSVYSASIGSTSQIHLEIWSAPYSAGLTKNLGTNVAALAAWACQSFFLASATVAVDTSTASTNTTNNTTLPTGGPTPTQSGDTEELVYAWNSSGTISSFAAGSVADGASQANSTTISVGFGQNSTASLSTSADTAFAQTLSGNANRKVGVGVNILATFPPNIPTSSAASSITETGFSANWSASATDATHSAADGYFLDVATDVGFVSPVTGYNNKDVGNVTTSAVTGLSAGVAYWYRVRAYNLAATSSSSSSQNPTTTTLTAWVQYARFEVPIAPTGNQTVTPSLLSSGPTLYGPAVSSNFTVSPAAVNRTPTVYAPSISTGVTSVLPALVSRAPVLYAPAQFNQTLNPSLVGAAAVYSPASFAVTLAVPLVSRAPTVYVPAFTGGGTTITPARVSRTPTVYAPAFVAAAEVLFARFEVPTAAPATPALVTSGPTVYVPSAFHTIGTQTVAPAVIPAVGTYGTGNYGEGFFGGQLGAPQFNFNANPVRVSRSPIVFGPLIFPRLGTLAPARVTRTATVLGPVITQTIHPARVIPIFSGVFGPTLVRGVIILAPALVNRTPTIYVATIQTPAQIVSPKPILPAGTWGGGGWGDGFYGTQLPPVVLAPGVAIPPLLPALVGSAPVLFLPKINQLKPALVGGAPTLYVPALNQVLAPARVGADTVYVPLFNSAANLFPLLVSRTATASTPVLNQQLKPAQTTNPHGVFQPAAVGVATHPALVSRTPTVYAVLFLATNSLSPALVSRTPAVYAPTVTPGTATVAPALDARTPTVYAPAVTQTIHPALVSSARAISTPLFTTANTLSPLSVSRTATAFAPALAPGPVTVAPARVPHAATIPSPSLVPGVAPLDVPIVGSTGTVYAPALVQRVRPAQITRVPVAYTPASLSHGNITVTLNTITSGPVVYAVQIVLPPPAAGAAIYFWPLGPGTAVPGGNAPAPGVAAGTPWTVGAGVAVAERT